MRKQLVGFILGLFVLSLTGFADETGTELRVQFKKGEVQKLKMTQKQSMAMQIPGQPLNKTMMSNVMDMETECDDVVKGIASLRQKLSRARMTIELPAPLSRTLEYDSSDSEPTDPVLVQIDKMMRPMMGVEMTMKSDSLGKITEFAIPASALEGIKNSPAAAFGGDMFSEAGMKQMTEQSALSMPNERMKIGDKWTSATEVKSPLGKMTVTRVHTYKGTIDNTQGQHTIDVTATIALEPDPNSELPFKAKLVSGGGEGQIIFDNNAGRLIRSKINTKMVMELNVGNQIIKQDIDSIVTVEAIVGADSPSAAR
ncbi:MAG: DUF6263 family protein [Planctomycetota bacterium]|nr:DUF6263 family protein [Planctomycetota bacterium]